jgi:hypothetical protein
VRVGFTRALDQHQTRALLDPIKDDCGTVRRNVEIANHEVCGQFGQLAERRLLITPLGSRKADARERR